MTRINRTKFSIKFQTLFSLEILSLPRFCPHARLRIVGKNVVVNNGSYANYGTLNNYVNEKLYESQQELINSLKRENEHLRKQANQAQ